MSAALYTRIPSAIEWKWICHATVLCINIGFVLLVDEQFIPVLYGVMVLECAIATGIRYWKWPEESCAEWRNTRLPYVALALILLGGAIWAQVDAVRIEWETNYNTLDGFWWRHSIWHMCCGFAFWARCMVVAPPIPVLLNLNDLGQNEFTLLERGGSTASSGDEFFALSVTPPYPTHINFAV
jgi:hypothetical protein